MTISKSILWLTLILAATARAQDEPNISPKALAGRARANLNLRKSNTPEPGTGKPDPIQPMPSPQRKDEGNPMKKRPRKGRIMSGLIL